MSYLPGFRFDLFLSYRHDAEHGPVPWVGTFHERVRTSLLSRVGAVEIFKDTHELRIGDAWRLRILEALDQSAVFIAILNGTYYQSSECLFELDNFLRRLKEEPAGHARRALIPVLRHPPSGDFSVPSEIADAQYMQFFDYDPQNRKLVREFGPGASQEAALQFESTVQRFVAELEIRLLELHGHARAQSLGTVFLADVSIDQSATRDKIKADLHQRGYAVRPSTARYLWSSDSVRESIAADLAKADACIHLVSATGRKDPEMPARSRIQLDLALAAMKSAGKPLPVVWIEHDALADDGARDLVTYVKTTLADQGVDHWIGSLEAFKSDLFARLAALRQSEGTGPAVALIVDRRDAAAGRSFAESLRRTFAAAIKTIEIDPARSGGLPDLSGIAHQPGGRAIVYWGAESRPWLVGILTSDELAALGGRERVCVYCADPSNDVDWLQRTNLAQPVRAAHEHRGAALRRFLGGPELQ